MKRVRINKGKVGLVFRNGDYIKVLKAGSHWVWFSDKVGICNMSQPFTFSMELNILLQDDELASMLDVIEVQDHEMVLKYENGVYQEALTSGRYAYWKGVTNFTFKKVDLSKVEITEDIPVNILYKPDIYPQVRIYRVESYERGLLFVEDKFIKELNQGVYYYWKNNTPVLVMKADLRQTQLEISGQELLTKDKAAIRISFFASYIVVDAKKALTENQDYKKQLHVTLQLALREYVGTLTLDEILERKEEVAEFVMSSARKKAMEYGVELSDGGIRDIILPGEVKEIMNQVLVAQKKAQANIITRREETASTRSLLNTAKLMEDNQMLFKLKEMENVEKIADKINTITLSGGGKVVDQLKEIFSTDR
ncbi:slipin family protein [Plebeiibacterium sediminum]|uniref:Slipin family protein n=1 Tax=Plebeiibacterium sediminum TaxID=2992112 RepID=A0AAE3M763_9BACT|nr:slipin family protein [Plebeiobacterium sediminum]MCW3788172.1 slipin family protein [Plebeiobacterium sediminum]